MHKGPALMITATGVRMDLTTGTPIMLQTYIVCDHESWDEKALMVL
jgi:hypothetical protein